MKKLNEYLKTWEELIFKLKTDDLTIYRLRDCVLYGESYLFLIPKRIKETQGYLLKKYSKNSETSLKKLLKDKTSTIQIFNGPLERESLSLENLRKLMSDYFVQVRTNELNPHITRRNYPDSEKIDKRYINLKPKIY
jgi:hypothetical protein